MWNVKISPTKQEKDNCTEKTEYLKSHFKKEETVHKYKVLKFINNPGTKTIRKQIHILDRQKTKSQYQILERMWGNEKSNTHRSATTFEDHLASDQKVKPKHTLRPSASTLSYIQTKERVQQGVYTRTFRATLIAKI